MRRKLITLTRIFNAGVINFIRNISLGIAAIAVMVVTLTIILFSVITNAAFQNSVNNFTAKIDVSVFLKDSTTQDQTKQLIKELKALPSVKSITYLSKEQALKQYLASSSGNQQLINAISITSNPLPATILIKPTNLNEISDIKTFLDKPNIIVLQSDQASYSGDRKAAIDKITHATNALREIGLITVIVFTVISALIIFNTIQMAIFNRRDEISIMRLLGASKWYIRGPFIVESSIYGIFSAIISLVIINSAFLASSNALQATSLGLLDINYANQYFDQHFLLFLGIQLVLGILIATISALIATRRFLKFKTK